MLRICSKALLLSSVSKFVSRISSIASDIDVELEVSEEWNTGYRMDAEVIICGSKYLDSISTDDYDKVRLVLKTDETVAVFLEMGITHFIFDYTNDKEVAFSFFVEETEKQIDEMSLEDILCKTHRKVYEEGKYDFNFGTNSFKYDGVGIYLTEGEKAYLAKWLFLGNKENEKRILLYKMRKKFGKSFMKDIDRLGKYKGNAEA